VRISAKLDQAVRAAIGLTAASDEKPICAERLATVQGGPPEYSTYAGAATAPPRSGSLCARTCAASSSM
jgi:hypothetical protein